MLVFLHAFGSFPLRRSRRHNKHNKSLKFKERNSHRKHVTLSGLRMCNMPLKPSVNTLYAHKLSFLSLRFMVAGLGLACITSWFKPC